DRAHPRGAPGSDPPDLREYSRGDLRPILKIRHNICAVFISRLD
ncbi:MAG: hypothetical protein ACI9MB_003690, partial [Verrucomicrobiales bacterium]